MTRHNKLLVLCVSIFLSLILIATFKSYAGNSKQKKRAPLTVLQSSEKLITNDYVKKTRLASSKDGQKIYALDQMTGDLLVYERKHKSLKKAASLPGNVEVFTVDAHGNLYLGRSDSTVRILDARGQELSKFPVVYPRSIAVLRNGNVVIASPSGGKLLHLYNPTGSLLGSFGNMRTFDSSPVENEFLNRGQVIAGPADEIYYVSTYAPAPYVLKSDSLGALVAEFPVEGDAITFQTDVLKDFLSERKTDQTGGFTIINSASVNPETGHLWVAMNGLSTTSTIYEYDNAGIKVREYALLLNSPTNSRQNVTHPKDLIVNSSTLDILTWGGIYSFKFSDIIVRDDYGVGVKDSSKAKSSNFIKAKFFSLIKSFLSPAPPMTPAIPQGNNNCGQPQNYDCQADCPNGSNPTSVDCGAQITPRLRTQDVVTSASCEKKTIDATPGSSNPGGCTETVQFCNTADATTGSITVTVNCNAVPRPLADLNCSLDPHALGCPPEPIVVDILGNGFNLTSNAGGVNFDLDNDGQAERLSWTSFGSDDAWLALDRNGNGKVDNGAELFGNYTAQPASPNPNGFLALAEFDKPQNGGNADGEINKNDGIFSSLRLWQDANHNGISEAVELHTLSELGIAHFELDYKESKRVDQYGNKFRYRAKVKDTSDAHLGRWAWDVFLVPAP